MTNRFLERRYFAYKLLELADYGPEVVQARILTTKNQK